MKTKLLTLAATMLLSTCAYAQQVDGAPMTPPENNGYVRDINARMLGDWVIVPTDYRTGVATAQRFDLYWTTPDVSVGVVAYRSGKNIYSCSVTLPTGSAIECNLAGGTRSAWRFVGAADGANRFVGELNGVPALMVRVQ
ncbi:MAG: hypothetical protein FWC38_00460 [Proteobacteria bacterium]|nr:hypothetical protein [Pseudomonadota bacterium]MCL2306714.1 hypothetical protein [Pseudomonadota bacterium]